MKSDVLVKLLKESNGSHVYDVWVPSMKRTVKFLPLTVGQQKTISKLAMDVSSTKIEDEMTYRLQKKDVIVSLATEMLDEAALTEIDAIAISAAIRRSNVMAPLKMTMKCDCGEEMGFVVDFDSIITKCKEFNFKDVEVEKVIQDKKWKIILGDATFDDSISYKNLQAMYREEGAERLVIDVEKFQFMDWPAQFIKRVFVDDEEVEDIPTMSLFDKIGFFISAPQEVWFGEGNVLDACMANFNQKYYGDLLFQDVVCPKCKKTHKGVVSYDSFFTL